ncbi:ThuA domain-containing protein [Microbacterium sp. 179-B 1A2 NHS]|uniref:ThuA domain-containing protein n=1 Tax=Microbacterium sp. 179-B 1A2 NHS TaxID=3142383 RepID=UPI00399F029A
MTVRTLILTGEGRYADPWHPFAETTDRLREILVGAGHDVAVRGDIDAAMAELGGVDLLVVNAGDPWSDGERGAPAASLAGFEAALERGMGVLAMHSAASSLRDYPSWAGAVGAIWLPELSFHPPHGDVDVRVERMPLPGLPGGFRVRDEKYCALQLTGRREVVAWHSGADEPGSGPEPAAWRRTLGHARIAVDVLGHDARSYDSAGHRRLVEALAAWAAAADDR